MLILLIGNHRIARVVAGALALLLLSGCLSLGGEVEPVKMYRLTPLAGDGGERPEPVAMVITVASARMLDSQRLWVFRHDREVQGYAGLRWAMPAPQMFRLTLIESLENTGTVVAVDEGAAPGYLKVQLRAFQVEVDSGGRASVEIGLLATLETGGADPRHRLFRISRATELGSANAVTATFDEAARDVIRDLQAWLQRQLS